MLQLIRWLSQQPNAAKHSQGWAHPIAACFTHYLISSVIIILAHDKVLVPLLHHTIGEGEHNQSLVACFPSSSNPHPRLYAARISMGYVIMLIVVRLTSNKPGVARTSALYETTWMCNAALIFGAFGLFTCRPIIATAFAVAVSIDQILWYVDFFGYIMSGFRKFPIGVCSYILWPQTPWSSRITCTHHFWTIPLLIYGARGLHWASYPFSSLLVLCHMVLSRWLTPFRIPVNVMMKKDDEPDGRMGCKYLNVNLAHELWSDIKIKILRESVDNRTAGVYILRTFLWWQLFNFLCFVCLHVASSGMYE
mmetsp:Transcript_29203/g.45383  ORF Transcript_29203/g.45383 Transcript_29203/m.45383 type:complete len:308 (-) Transcript_29203:97-1020(-)